MTPEEAKKLRIATFAELIKANKIYLPSFALPVASPPAATNTIDTIIVIAPTRGSFAHFTDACRDAGWTQADGRVRQNQVRVEQHVKNYVDDYVIYVARRW